MSFTCCCGDFCMRLIQRALSTSCNRTILQDFACKQSSFLAAVWWSWRTAILLSAFLETHSRHRFWLVNTVVYVDSGDIHFSVTSILFRLPPNDDDNWEIPTPPLQISD